MKYLSGTSMIDMLYPAFPGRRGKGRPLLSSLAVLCIIMLLASCAALKGGNDLRDGKLLFRDVRSRPGTAAWSPGSDSLAVITDRGLVITDPASGLSSTVPGLRPVFVEWAPGDNLLVVNETDGKEEVMEVTASGTVRTMLAQDHSVAVRWLVPPDTFTVLTSETSRYSIGTFVKYTFSKVTPEGKEAVYSWESYFATRDKGIDAVSGWTYAGVRPVHETILAPEFHDPPRLEPFTLFRTVDAVTGEVADLARVDSERFSVPSSWSPDGSRLAVTDDEGLLVILDPDDPEDAVPVSRDISGRYPAWNPRGDLIYLGGWVFQDKGTHMEKIVHDAFDSLGVWSPDGTKLAVLRGNELLYFEGLPLSAGGSVNADQIAGRRDRLRLLKRLLKEGLITDEEYRSRRTGLIAK